MAHYDDEFISMAGTTTRHVSRGDKVIVISMTDGVSARDSAKKDDINGRKASQMPQVKSWELNGVNATILMIMRWMHIRY